MTIRPRNSYHRPVKLFFLRFSPLWKYAVIADFFSLKGDRMPGSKMGGKGFFYISPPTGRCRLGCDHARHLLVRFSWTRDTADTSFSPDFRSRWPHGSFGTTARGEALSRESGISSHSGKLISCTRGKFSWVPCPTWGHTQLESMCTSDVSSRYDENSLPKCYY